MAMDETRLGQALVNAVDSAYNAHIGQNSNPTDGGAAYRNTLWKGIAKAFIDEIKNHANIGELSVTVPVGGSPVHTHTPTVTVSAEGKIS